MLTDIRGKITALVAKNWDLQQLEPYSNKPPKPTTQ